jgi:hypothetical protein
VATPDSGRIAQQQKVILGVTLADTEGTTTAPLLQMTTAAELGELPSALLGRVFKLVYPSKNAIATRVY